MTTRIRLTAQGGIILRSEYQENASGHVESSQGVELFAVDDTTLMLNLFESRSILFNEVNEICYEIEADQLIEFIKQNGTMTRKRKKKLS